MNTKIALTPIVNMEIAKTIVPAALTSGVNPARSISKIMTGKVTSNRLSKNAIINSSQDNVAERQNEANKEGFMIGAITRSSVCASLAPRSLAAQSMLRK